jgi:predicted DNA-binding transcriptional regulator
MSKDQTIGGAILAVCVIVALLYVLTLFYPTWLVSIGLIGSTANVSFWTIAIPVFVAFIAILGIGAWIGYTMATTPPPKPIEEITTEAEPTPQTNTTTP